MNDWEAPFYIYEQSDEHKEIEALEAKLSLKESQLAIAKEALENALYNQECDKECQCCGNNEGVFEELKEALEKLK